MLSRSPLFIVLLFASASSFAQTAGNGDLGIPPGPGAEQNAPAIPSSAPKKEDTGLFDQSSPYLDYGDFNMNEDENEDAVYFQYGKFFAFSLGLGYQTALGNRGKLYEPALPRLDIRVQYWFNFNLALDMGVFFATHQFTDSAAGSKATTVKLNGYGVHLKYYFDVRDASAALSFSNPFLSVGAGSVSKSQSTARTSGSSGTVDSDSTLSIDLGGGLEFPIVHKKTYFVLEGLYHTQNFEDSNESTYSKVPDLNGGFFSLLGHIMFVW